MSSKVVKKTLGSKSISITVDSDNVVVIEELLERINTVPELLKAWLWLETRKHNIRILLDGGLCKEIVSCVERMFYIDEGGASLKGILNNGLMNMLHFNIAIDLYTPTKPITITVTDTGKHSMLPQVSIGNPTLSVPYLDKNVNSDKFVHIGILPEELLSVTDIAELEAFNVEAASDTTYQTFRVTSVGNMRGWIVPNTVEVRKRIKLLFQRLQRRYDASSQANRTLIHTKAIGQLKQMRSGTGNMFYGINQNTAVWTDTYLQDKWMIAYRLWENTKLGLKVSQDQRNIVLSFI